MTARAQGYRVSTIGALASCLGGGLDEPVTVNGRRLVRKGPIAEGACSFVELYADALTGELCAVKRIALRNDDGFDARQEVRLLASFDHPHIVRFKGVSELAPTAGRPLAELLLQCEYCSGGRLPEALARRGRLLFSEREVLNAFRGVVDAVAYLHSLNPPVIHLDIKAENVLLSAPIDLADPMFSLPSLKLCDFGSAIIATVPLSSTRGLVAMQERLDSTTTLAYRSPELVDLHAAFDRGVREIGPAADCWALGCLLFRLAYLEMPFPDNKLAILNGKVAIPSIEPPPFTSQLNKLISAMLEVDPVERLTAEQAVGAIDELIGRLPAR